MPSDVERAAALALIQRIENASSDGFFPCEADVDEAVEFALEAFAAIRAEYDAAHAERIKALEEECSREKAAALGLQQGTALVVKDLEARLAAAKAEGRAEAFEEAARLVETKQETFTSSAFENRRHLTDRRVGNLAGLAFADGIRSLPASPAPASEETVEHAAIKRAVSHISWGGIEAFLSEFAAAGHDLAAVRTVDGSVFERAVRRMFGIGDSDDVVIVPASTAPASEETQG